MSVVGTVLLGLFFVAATFWAASNLLNDPNVIRFRRDLRMRFHPKSDPLAITRLEHDLGVAGHKAENCLQCDPTTRMPARFSRGGVVLGPQKPMRLVADCSPDGQGSLSVIYADECFLSSDGICVRKDDLHAAVGIQTGRWWICPLHD